MGATQHTKGIPSLISRLGLEPTSLELADLKALIDELQGIFQNKVLEKRRFYERELSELSNLSVVQLAAMDAPSGDRRAVVLPKFRSKKDPSLTWSGRGSIPRWIKQEMKELRLKKEDFRIRR
jgi:DNA-binding protein H-NS